MLGKKTEVKHSLHAALHYDKMNDKSTMPISEGLKEKKLKAPNAETAFVNDFYRLIRLIISHCGR